MTGYWICCNCDASLACSACGVEQPDDSAYYNSVESERNVLRARSAKDVDALLAKENEIARLMTESIRLRRIVECRTFDPCPYEQDGCLLENQEVGPCLCANPPRIALLHEEREASK